MLIQLPQKNLGTPQHTVGWYTKPLPLRMHRKGNLKILPDEESNSYGNEGMMSGLQRYYYVEVKGISSKNSGKILCNSWKHLYLFNAPS
ncbi:UNVERIFIED_CONTAM: hypothetical protein NCL1_42837 [Trichonephila clavipes]